VFAGLVLTPDQERHDQITKLAIDKNIRRALDAVRKVGRRTAMLTVVVDETVMFERCPLPVRQGKTLSSVNPILQA
jgi:hypothetical protein